MARVRLLHQQGEVEPRGSTAENGDFQEGLRITRRMLAQATVTDPVPARR
jgi:hypothetical protein